MSDALSLAFPGSRKLAEWWRQLTSYRPQALWVAHLFLHQVEALTRLTHVQPVDAWTLFVLKAVALESAAAHAFNTTQNADTYLALLDARLHLGRQVLVQALRRLQAQGLARTDEQGLWELTALGRQALDQRHYPQAHFERRRFHFVSSHVAQGLPGRPPPFVDLHNSTGISWPLVEGLEFDPRLLHACLTQPPEWKQQRGFPPDVEEILDLKPEKRSEGTLPAIQPQAIFLAGELSMAPPFWQRVIVDRPEQILVALVLTPGETGQVRLLGLAIRQENWILQNARPLFSLDADWPEVFPELMAEPSPESWRQAWRAWCEPRGLSSRIADACILERRGERLVITAPARLIEHLRVTRSDALKGETWLLAGDGRIRTAARVELIEAEAQAAGV